MGDLLIIHEDVAAVRADQPDDDVERSSLAGAVRAQQPDHLSLLDRERDMIDDAPSVVGLC
jgi:hypothetical protein